MNEELPYMDEIIAEFMVETQELLEKLDGDLVMLEKAPDDLALINDIFRGAHTIKGTSGFLGFQKMSRLTHAAEDILNRMRKGNLAINPEIMDAILDTVDRLRALLDAIRATHSETEIEVDNLIARLQALNGAAAGGEAKQKSGDTDQEEQDPAAARPVSAAKRSKQKTGTRQKKRTVSTVQPEIPAGDAGSQPAGNAARPPDREGVAKKRRPMRSEGLRESLQAQTVRVPVRRLDHLMNLAGELVLSRNRLNQITSFCDAALNASAIRESWGELRDVEPERQELFQVLEKNIELLSETNSQIGLVTAELQMAIMQTRMLPVDTLFKKVPRQIRDLARDMEKKVELIIEGAETELDKSVIEDLGDPLTHLIRNSLDHGIELPHARRAAGKPEEGKLRLFASQEGNHIVVGIADDGDGIDADRVKAKAVEKGLISEAAAQRMNEREAINLIFAPGFSTAAAVTNVSGRGVGLDVVKTNVSRLNGMIEVESKLGKGTTFLLKLPLTLAIIQGLLVGVADEVFIIPIVSVLETLRVNTQRISRIGSKPVIQLRDALIPVVNLQDFFNIERQGDPPHDNYIVIIAVANKKIGLAVDRLLGQEEVVIKSLGDFFDESEAIAGATIMGDGRIRLIIDVSEIVRMEQEKVT